ncbi:hypothetical protein LSTR_LSTR010039 [Laodelphax striatellus]|uniref:Serpin domain-containing protein n=1 Tax=Laodelphax striatellus TaxID=195883 RepID=A0A482WN37_LAOST|nr:hypothetical protein LSTR_LSTR010039 [Laodelphax striatellus]
MFHNQCFVSVLVSIQVIIAIPDVVSQRQLKKIADPINQFAIEFQYALSKKNAGNTFCSPIGLQMALAMASVGAGDNTTSYDEIKTLLRFPNDTSEMLSDYSLLSDTLTSFNELKMAYRIYIDQKFTVKPEYLETTKKYFKSDAELVDFLNNADAAAAVINSWVEQQTNNKIKDLITEGALTSKTVMVLINAMHFNANWKYVFKKELTRKEKFYLDETKTVDVDMMHITNYYHFQNPENLKATVLELPYEGDEFSMIIVLPETRTGLADVQAQLTRKNYMDLMKIMRQLRNPDPVLVHVSLPKFKMDQTHDNLVDVLKELRVREIFSDNANFLEIDPNNAIKVSKIIQKVFVGVDEKGTEAADPTPSFAPELPSDFEFQVDHPFFCIIMKKISVKHSLILFFGEFTGN